MTEKEKAIELYEEMFYKITSINNIKVHDKVACDCAIIAVEKIIEVLNEISIGESGTTKIDYGQSFYKEVKKEINLLKI